MESSRLKTRLRGLIRLRVADEAEEIIAHTAFQTAGGMQTEDIVFFFARDSVALGNCKSSQAYHQNNHHIVRYRMYCKKQ